MSLDLIAARMAQAERELQAQGHSPERALLAIHRATRWAQRLSAAVPGKAREATFLALLDQQLLTADAWLRGLDRAAEMGHFRRSMERAHDRDDLELELGRGGGDGKRMAERWKATVPGAIRAWEGRMGA